MSFVRRLVTSSDLAPDVQVGGGLPAVWVDALSEGSSGDVAIDSTGVKYTGRSYFKLPAALLDSASKVYLEGCVYNGSGVSDAELNINILEADTGTVVATLTIALSGNPVDCGEADITGTLSADKYYVVNFEVKTASATSGAVAQLTRAALRLEA